MGILVLLCVLLIVFIGLIVLGNRYDSVWMPPIGIIFGGIDLLVIAIVISSMMTQQSDFDYIESRYYNLKEQVKYCEHDDIVTDANLRQQVLDMNNTIAKHRVYSHNIWVSMYYSERIGKLKNLKWEGKK